MNSHRFRPSPAVRASISPDGLVLLDVAAGAVFAANPVGARIWQLLDEQRTTPEIVRQLVRDYDVAADRAEGDVAAFVAALVARGLLTEQAR